MKIKMKKNGSYADSQPSTPIVSFVKDQVVTVGEDVTTFVACLIMEGGAGEEVTEEKKKTRTTKKG